jgi:hypothetical protein
LPVADVARYVAVDEEIEEVSRAGVPIDVEVLAQERRCDEAGAVVHPALARKLPHTGVDERIARATVAPGLYERAAVAPAVAAGTEVFVRQLGPGAVVLFTRDFAFTTTSR